MNYLVRTLLLFTIFVLYGSVKSIAQNRAFGFNVYLNEHSDWLNIDNVEESENLSLVKTRRLLTLSPALVYYTSEGNYFEFELAQLLKLEETLFDGNYYVNLSQDTTYLDTTFYHFDMDTRILEVRLAYNFRVVTNLFNSKLHANLACGITPVFNKMNRTLVDSQFYDQTRTRRTLDFHIAPRLVYQFNDRTFLDLNMVFSWLRLSSETNTLFSDTAMIDEIIENQKTAKLQFKPAALRLGLSVVLSKCKTN